MKRPKGGSKCAEISLAADGAADGKIRRSAKPSATKSNSSESRSNGVERNPLVESLQRTFEVGLKIAIKKNADYATEDDPFLNFTTGAQFLGLSVEKAILVRFMDKITRINNLLDHDARVVGESMEDSIIDAINYLGIIKAYRELRSLS